MKYITTIALLTLLPSCKRDWAVAITYQVTCNKCEATYITPTGEASTLVRGEWKQDFVFEEGDELGITACRVQYDTTITNEGMDTTLTEVPYFGIRMWAFEKGDPIEIESAGNTGDVDCSAFTAKVPEQ